jgi:hypothetical protein
VASRPTAVRSNSCTPSGILHTHSCHSLACAGFSTVIHTETKIAASCRGAASSPARVARRIMVQDGTVAEKLAAEAFRGCTAARSPPYLVSNGPPCSCTNIVAWPVGKSRGPKIAH